jgi:hypothetical protein
MVRTKTNKGRINKRVKKSSMKKKHKRKSTKRRSLRGGSNNNDETQKVLEKLDEALVSNINLLKLKKPWDINLVLTYVRNAITKSRRSLGRNIPLVRGDPHFLGTPDFDLNDYEKETRNMIKSRIPKATQFFSYNDNSLATTKYLTKLKKFYNKIENMPILFGKKNIKDNYEIIINYVCEIVVKLLNGNEIVDAEYIKIIDDLSNEKANALKNEIEKKVIAEVPKYNNPPINFTNYPRYRVNPDGTIGV